MLLRKLKLMFKKTQIFRNIDQNNVISRRSFNLLAEWIVSLIKRSFTTNDEISCLHISIHYTLRLDLIKLLSETTEK